ncbi:MAG: glycosyltransferase family 4 protein [Pyrinomonadaceae bacterium]|nr:glycosyltransferase family 4 protein [Pyrinomonadaceae bacterium]
MNSDTKRLRVLFVPDSVHWVTGTIAKSIARFNPWIEATIASGPVIDTVLNENPELMRNFDLVHFTCPYSSRQWLPRFRDLVPCVTSHHHVTDWELIKHNVEGDAIIVGSTEWSEDLRARGVDIARVFCVPYGVDADFFQPATEDQRKAIRRRLNFLDSTTVVGFFGKNSSNDDDRKGIDVFTRGVVSLSKRIPELAVLVVGPGWQELTSGLNASGVKCVWIPFVAELKGLAEMYQALDFYWVTARVEGGPVTLLEAMSTEVCCLTTAVGIAREIVTDGENAALLPFNDPEAFAERTVSLAADTSERRRLGSNARKTILETMHVGVTATGVVDVYAKAFENFAARRQCSVPLNVHAIAGAVAAQPLSAAEMKNEIPLKGFPSAIHRRVRMLESLAFGEHLILYHKQRSVALRMIMREWRANPFSPLPLRVLLRRLLPVPMVARLVKLKNRSRSEPELVAH